MANVEWRREREAEEVNLREGWHEVEWPGGTFLVKGWRTADSWEEVDRIENRARDLKS